jgi:hypothetical protein
MSDAKEALNLLGAAEQRQRDEARQAAQATPEPTPEQRHEQFAAELADRLQAAQSTWVTFGGNG